MWSPPRINLGSFIVYRLPNAHLPPHFQMSIYADDMTYTSSSSIHKTRTRLQDSLSVVNDWTLANKMALNITKTHSMLFGTHQRLKSKMLDLSLNGTPISYVQTVKYLGLSLDSSLAWKDHYTNKTISKSKS